MKSSPPKFARFLLKTCCDARFHEEVEGDLDELFAHNIQMHGPKKAAWYYWKDVFKHFNWYFISRRRTKSSSQNLIDMWTNYLRIAFRNIFKNPGYSALNMLGLGVGMACALLILKYSLHELGFDKFHEKGDRTYVVHMQFPNEEEIITSAPNALVPTLIRELPELETGVRIFNRGSYSPFTVKYKENVFKENRLFHVDSTFFDVFSFKLLEGDPKRALVNPKSIVLTEEMAAKYFGSEEPMGKTLRIDNRHDYLVTGVIENPPSNSHIHFDFLVSYTSFTNRFFLQERWDNASYTSYLVLNENASASSVEAKIPGIVKRTSEAEEIPRYSLNNLFDIHLSGVGAAFGLEAQNEMQYLYIFGFIGVLILIIASINYTNLATARAVFRAKEIGMRKVLGAYRFNLFHQFMGESILVVFMAFLLALLLAVVALPSFNQLADRQFVIADLWQSNVIGGIVLVAFFVAMLAGIYPALVLSGFRPITVLRGSFKNSKSGVVMRKLLVTVQFVISIALIIGTSVVFEQLKFMKQKELGYNNDNMLILPLSSSILRNYPAFKSEMMRESSVLDMTLASESPTQINAGYSIILKDIDEEKKVMVAGLRADLDFLGALQMELVAGTFITEADVKNIAREIPSEDRVFAFVLNEEALAPFGISPEEAIGKRAYMNGRNGFIRGVVKNFHFASMREKIRPMAFLPERDFNKVLIRISGQNLENTLSKVQERWRRLAPNVPFEYEFMDLQYANLYSSEQKLSKLFGLFAGLTIFISCFGLLGLISFTTIQRAREIGVRKVLGASTNTLVLMLNKDFSKLILVAFLIATPLAYLFMSNWLAEFQYKIGIGVTPIILSLVGTTLIAFLTTSFQSFRAASANPVDVLKEQ